MAPAKKGPERQTLNRVMHLLDAILAYAEAPLDEQKQQSFRLEVNWEENSDSPRLQVKTTRGDLEQLSQSKFGTDSQFFSGFTLSKENIRHLMDSMENDWEIVDSQKSSQGKKPLSFTLELSSKHKNENLRWVQEQWNEWNPEAAVDLIGSEQPEGINWGEICQSMLKPQRELVSNLFTSVLRIRLDLEQIYVPLRVVEYFEKPQGLDDSSPESWFRVYQKEKRVPIDYESFLQKVLAQGQSPKSQGKRLSLIGEPGTGKTVQLLKIADWVRENNQGLPIWVSLAAVGKKTLQQYLVEDWLLQASSQLVAAPSEWVKELNQLLQDGRVWLLLDGADEMGVTHPLATLAQQLKMPLWKNVQVVLTCRVNVWDDWANPLSEFDTYKLLDLGDEDSNQPERQKLFIDKFFAASHSDSGERLWAVLNETGNKRIKDLVLNPLRLLLLCVTWQAGSNQLLNTKLQIYDNFVEALYRLKQQEQFYTTAAQRLNLNAALGHLAHRALDAGVQSLLPHRLVGSELLKPHPELFEKALQLGFLNQVSTDPTNPLQSLFAFWHPTLAEYFAARAIDDWHFFCEFAPNSPDGEPPRYRVLEPQWREVFLLWLEREDVSEQKEPFLQYLLLSTFLDRQNGSNKLDWYQAIFLIVAGIAEFKDFSWAEDVIDLCIELSNPRCFYDRQQGWIVVPKPVSHQAREALLQTDRNLANTQICKRLRGLEQPMLSNCDFMLLTLEQIGTGNSEALDTLTELLSRTHDEELALLTAITLGTINPDNSNAIQTLIDLLQNHQNPVLLQAVFESLEAIANQGNSDAINALTELLSTTQNQELALSTAITLNRIDPGNSMAIQTLVKRFRNSLHTKLLETGFYGSGDSTDGGNKVSNNLAALLKILDDEELVFLAGLNLRTETVLDNFDDF